MNMFLRNYDLELRKRMCSPISALVYSSRLFFLSTHKPISFLRYNRAMAAGLFQLQVERAPYVSATIFGNPSLTCLNEYEWDKTVNGVESYNLNLYLPLLYIVIGSHVISLVVLVKECVQKKLSRLIRKFMEVARDQGKINRV